MPADRSKLTGRGAEEAHQLVWTIPVEPATVEAEGTAFLSNNSAIDFDDGPPPLVDRDLIFCPPFDEAPPASRKTTHGKKKPEDHIPRPPNAFILFRSSFIKGQHVPTEVETNHSTLSKIIGLTWKNLPNEERMFWHAKAKAALDEHKRKFPQYTFRPSQGRSKGAGEKRKVREVGPKDPVRCAKIAQLLVEGKKGQELDAAIQEFDKHHKPQIVTRFDKPMTAGQYRRSSSAPIPDDIERPKPKPVQKSRSVSAQPGTPVLPSAPFSVRSSVPLETSFSTSFDQFSFQTQPQPSPSFELNTFSFDQPTTTYIQPCHPVTESLSPSDCRNTLFQDNMVAPPSDLSIDTTFLGVDSWSSGCASPLSSASSLSTPPTPSSYMASPYPEYPTFTLESLEHSLAKSFGNAYPVYPPHCESSFAGEFADAGSPSEYPPFEACSPKFHMANQDLDFSVFMATLPEYPH